MPTLASPTHPRLSAQTARQLITEHGSPLYVYNASYLAQRATLLRSFTAPFGFTPRFSVKTNSHPHIIELFTAAGLHYDASSSYEAAQLLEQGVDGARISLSGQQPAHNLPELLRQNVQYVATSLHQLELFLQTPHRPAQVALRVNAGVGSGHNRRNTTAGTAASFGLWHEYLPQALALAHKHGVTINRLHTHIGSGADPTKWEAAITVALAIAEQMPHVTTLDMGGGYKVQRVAGEAEANLAEIIEVFSGKLQQFAQRTGRQLHLEIEPGNWLVAHAGSLLTSIVDIVDTGAQGYTFLRTDTGMNDFLRPTLYGAQHSMRVLSGASTTTPYVVVGHNCESGDILTTAPGDAETIEPRQLATASIGDLLVIEDTGAYCASLRAKGYNAFPEAGEVFE